MPVKRALGATAAEQQERASGETTEAATREASQQQQHRQTQTRHRSVLLRTHREMFFLLTLDHHVLLSPQFFGSGIQDIVKKKLFEEVEGTCVGTHGFIIQVTKVVKIEKGRILPGLCACLSLSVLVVVLSFCVSLLFFPSVCPCLLVSFVLFFVLCFACSLMSVSCPSVSVFPALASAHLSIQQPEKQLTGVKRRKKTTLQDAFYLHHV